MSNKDLVEKYTPDQVAEMIISIDPTFYLPSDEQRPIMAKMQCVPTLCSIRGGA